MLTDHRDALLLILNDPTNTTQEPMAHNQTLPDFLVSRCKADITDLYESLRLVERHKALQAIQADEQCVNALPYLASTLSNLQSVLGISRQKFGPSLEEVTKPLQAQEGER